MKHVLTTFQVYHLHQLLVHCLVRTLAEWITQRGCSGMPCKSARVCFKRHLYLLVATVPLALGNATDHLKALNVTQFSSHLQASTESLGPSLHYCFQVVSEHERCLRSLRSFCTGCHDCRNSFLAAPVACRHFLLRSLGYVPVPGRQSKPAAKVVA